MIYRTVALAGEAVEIRGLQTPLTRKGRIVECQLSGTLVSLGRGGSRPAGCGMLGGSLESGGDDGVGAVDGEREMAGPFLDICNGVGERAVHRAELPTGASS